MFAVFPDSEALALAAAKVFVTQFKKTMMRSDRFTVVLSGGETPRRIYKLLAQNPFVEEVDWTKVHVFWGDERCVDVDDARSNLTMATKLLLSRVPIPPKQIHPIPFAQNPNQSAEEYEFILKQHFNHSPPRFDLVFLGLGLDGHTASLFPSSPALEEKKNWVVAVQNKWENFSRITLTLEILNQAEIILFLVQGREKAEILKKAFEQSRLEQKIPARLIQPVTGDLRWLVDSAANALINQKAVRIAPSILAADFGHLAAQISEVERCGADRIHLDVMDGHFVPSLSIGVPVIESLRKVTSLPFEIHLMISNPDFFLQACVDAGSDYLLVHVEGNNNLHRTVHAIKALGKRAGMVINPATPASALEEILADVDQVLVMTVNPGFGNQLFIHTTLPKIRRVRAMIDRINPGCDLEVDGGINATTAPLVIEAGANVLVAGSAIFRDHEGAASGMNRLNVAINQQNMRL